MKKETRYFLLLLLSYFAVNLLTLTRFPSVWVDEIQFADPAVRLASGQGFTSTAWFAQDSHRFFAGNVPLFSGLLGGWLSLVGPGLLAERLFNIALFAGFLTLVWKFLLRTEIVPATAWRMVTLALLATGHAMTFSYRSGRYDVLGMFLAAVCMNLWVSHRHWFYLGLVGVFLPAAGLQLLPGTLAVCAILVLLQGLPAVKRAVMLLAGCASGFLALRLLYRSFGVWSDFQRSTRAIGLIGQSVVHKLLALPGAYVNDKSRILLFAATLLLLAVALRTNKPLPQKRFVIGALATSLLLPAALQIAGKFPIYYGWMVFLPLAIACASLAASEWPTISQPIQFAVAALLAGAMFVGLPLRTASVLATWNERDPRRVAAFIQSSVVPGETALADFKLYYALRSSDSPTILPTYIPALRPDDLSRISVLLLRPEDVPAAQQVLGEQWQPTGTELAYPRSPAFFRGLITELREESYPIAVYRRAAVNSR